MISIAIAHNEKPGARSLVVCPATLVGHWASEIERFFGGKSDQSMFGILVLGGNEGARRDSWAKKLPVSNLIVTSYAVLRTDIARLSDVEWTYCVLDEGHLLKNPKTGKLLHFVKCR